MSQMNVATQYSQVWTPLMNCMCLALDTLSWMRKTTKLAGTKDMAKITQMDTRQSTDVVILRRKRALETCKCMSVDLASIVPYFEDPWKPQACPVSTLCKFKLLYHRKNMFSFTQK